MRIEGNVDESAEGRNAARRVAAVVTKLVCASAEILLELIY